jgi:hypothetical protein
MQFSPTFQTDIPVADSKSPCPAMQEAKVESGGKSDVIPAGRQATGRDHEIEIWMMCAMGVLVHGSQGSSKGVRFTVQLSNVCHMKRLAVGEPLGGGVYPKAGEDPGGGGACSWR